MKVVRYLESHAKPNDTMFVEIDNRHRFTGHGSDWAKFRQHLIKVIQQTLSDELAEAFEKETADWESTDADTP